MKEHNYYIYILASKPYGRIYIGVTNDLAHRVERGDLTANTVLVVRPPRARG